MFLGAAAARSVHAGDAKDARRDALDVCDQLVINEPHQEIRFGFSRDCILYDPDLQAQGPDWRVRPRRTTSLSTSLTTTRAGKREAGAAERPAARAARRMAGKVGQVQPVVADEARATEAEPRLAERPLDRSDQRVPVEPDRTLTFAAADQYFETLHRYIDLNRLDPFDRDAHCVVATQIVELGTVFTLDRLHP
jgi:hypothetical protein